MNVILLTAIILTVALSGQGMQGQLQPCQRRVRRESYETFVHRHVLLEVFDRNTLQAWKRYLLAKGLCGRTQVQSFIDAPEGQVQQICSRAGWRVQGATGYKGNLCISNSPMMVYDIYSDQNQGCTVHLVARSQKNVIVACDKIYNQCYPVHFERNTGQQRASQHCM